MAKTVSDTARKRLNNMGMEPNPKAPPTKMKSNDAKQIKVRQEAEALPEGLTRGKKKGY